MERRYRVTHPFIAGTVGNGAKAKIFRPGESVWWDEEGSSVPVVFKVDGFKWQADDPVQFAQSIELNASLLSRRSMRELPKVGFLKEFPVRTLNLRGILSTPSSALLMLARCDGANRQCQKAHAQQCRAQKEKSDEVALRSVLDHSHDVGTKKAA